MTDLFETVSLELALRPAVLVERWWLTDGYVRIRVAGESLRGFTSPGADDHVRLFLAGSESPTQPEEWRTLPSREYTPVAFDSDAGWVDFDMVIHGDGLASNFAAEAPIGSALAVAGPRRSRKLVGDPDSWFLAGDETALPAINRFLALRQPESPVRVLLEVCEANREVPVESLSRSEVTWVTRPLNNLADALGTLGDLDRPPGQVFAFVAGESRVVPAARALFARWQIHPDYAVSKGYWRQG